MPSATNKELTEYLEVRGYADAANWVYGQGIEPGDWTSKLIGLAEVRQVHSLAMAPVWDLAPHPQATPRRDLDATYETTRNEFSTSGSSGPRGI